MRTDLIHVLLRRWYVVITGVVVTVAMITAVLVLLPLKYSARADVVLWTTPAGPADNPLLDLSGLQDVPVTVARSVLDATAADTLAREGVTNGYSISIDPTTSAPLLIAHATGSTPQAATRALHLVVQLIPGGLQRLQQDVPTRALITYKVLRYHPATAVTRTRTRILLAATAVGLVLTGLLATTTDRVILYRRRKRELAPVLAPPVPPAEDDPDTTPPPSTPLRELVNDHDEPASAPEPKPEPDAKPIRRSTGRRRRSAPVANGAAPDAAVETTPRSRAMST